VNSTNAIEKALQQKISAECREIVDKFVADLMVELCSMILRKIEAVTLENLWYKELME